MTFDELSPTDSRFDALLRDLQAYGLVEHGTMDGEASWQLSPWARERLGQLATPVPSPDKLIFIGHRCATCGERRPTRSVAGSFLCDACTTARATTLADGWSEPDAPDAPIDDGTLSTGLGATDPQGSATSA
jgi:hypothetical protein